MENLKTEPDDIAIEFLVGKTELEGSTADFAEVYTCIRSRRVIVFKRFSQNNQNWNLIVMMSFGMKQQKANFQQAAKAIK